MKPIARTANSAPRGFRRTPVQCLVAEGRSSTGRAPVSKTGGSRFESWRPCGQKAPLKRGFLVWRLAVDNPRELRLVTRLETPLQPAPLGLPPARRGVELRRRSRPALLVNLACEVHLRQFACPGGVVSA